MVFGGNSSEHEVSCLTAGGVLRAIDASAFDVTCVGISKLGRWVLVPNDVVAGFAVVDGLLPSVPEDAPEVALLPRAAGPCLAVLTDGVLDLGVFDVAFALLHGPFGEDGTVQGWFELAGIRYVGAGVLASAVGMDKAAMKVMLAAAGIPVGPYVVLTDHDWRADPSACLKRVAALSFPVFVKPARGGSSLGITRVVDAEGLRAAIDEARRFDPKLVVEAGIADSREIECGVLEDPDGGSPRVSVPGEIVMHTADKFYDFEAKYLPEGQVTIEVPAKLDDQLTARVRELAARTFSALGVEGLARVDMFVRPDGTVLVNELNTMPGFTKFSMFPLVWAASGLEYSELLTTLIRLAQSRPLGLR